MSSGGSKTESKTTIDPAQLAMLQKNYGVAQDVAGKLSQSYDGQIIADANQTQTGARAAFKDIFNNNVGAEPLNSAIDSARGFMDFSPQKISTNYNPLQISSSYNPTNYTATNYTPTTYTPTNVTAGQLSEADLAKYLSPYTQNVIDTTGRDLERQRQIAGVGDNQRATRADAFGGSRHGVADSLTNEAYDRNSGTLFAGLRQTAFGNAQDQATADINRRLQADTTNQGAAFNAATLNTGNAYNAANLNTGNAYNAAALNQTGAFNAANLRLNADQANQGAGYNAAQLRFGIDQANQGADISGANLRLGAGTNLANYSRQQLDQAGQRAGFMSAAGDAEQAQRQAELTAQYSEFIRQLTSTAQGQQILNQAMQTFPNQGTTTQNTSQDMTGQLVGTGLMAAATF